MLFAMKTFQDADHLEESFTRANFTSFDCMRMARTIMDWKLDNSKSKWAGKNRIVQEHQLYNKYMEKTQVIYVKKSYNIVLLSILY